VQQNSTIQQTTIPNEEVFYTQQQIGNESATWLQDDVLIRNWLSKQSRTIQNQINPSDAAIERALNEFKGNFPSGRSYSTFLSTYNVSDGDVHTMLALILRRDNLQNYLYAQTTSPAKQVRARAITLSTQADADNILKQLKSGSDFAKLAESKSVDTNTKAKGGELGWLAKGEYTKNISQMVTGSGAIDNWLFDPARKVGDLSPVLTENGTYHIVQIEQIDPSRAIDSTTLQAIRGTNTNDSVAGNYVTENALSIWLLLQRAEPGVKVSQVDSTMLTDPMNMPTEVPISPPATATPSTDSSGASAQPGTGAGTGGTSGLPTSP
jgi:hypothetical protein